MKKITIVLLLGILSYSCASTHSVVRTFDLGMEKQDFLSKIGLDYALESISDTPDGRLEILRYPQEVYPAYFLVFLNGKLIEINRDHPPVTTQQNVNIVKEKKD